MTSPYLEERSDGVLHLRGTRIPLANVFRCFRAGESPESIRYNFSTLSLEQVYGAITFCLAHPKIAERDLRRLARLEDEAERTAPPPSPRLRRALARALPQPPRRAPAKRAARA